MNEKEIQSFSLETLLTVNEPRPEDLYFVPKFLAHTLDIHFQQCDLRFYLLQ